MNKLLREFARRVRADGPRAILDGAAHAGTLVSRAALHLTQRARFGSLGAGSVVLAPAMLTNPRYVHIGAGVTIRDGARIEAIRHHAGQTFGPRIDIGAGTFAEYRLQIECAERVAIGANVLIAGDVFISDVNHGPGDAGQHPLGTPLAARPVAIGAGTWIGQRACILPGVTLGEGCVVGAGAIVTKSFPAFSVVGGVPAKLLRTRER